MESIGRGAVEILVHTTALSRGPDDARYRALAQAYLDFEPLERSKLGDESIESSAREANSRPQEELLRSTQGERLSEASYRPEEEPQSVSLLSISSQYAYMNRIDSLGGLYSPILSFNSVMDNADSPGFRNYINHGQELPTSSQEQNLVRDSQDSWKPPPSIVSDSQPEPDGPVAALSSPSRVWEVFLKQIENSEGLVSAYGNEDNKAQQELSPELPYSHSEFLLSTSSIIASESSSASREPSSPSPIRKPNQHTGKSIQNRGNLPSTQNPATTLKRKRIELSEMEVQVSSSAPLRLSIKSSITTSSLEQTQKRRRVDFDRIEMTGSRIIPSSKTTEVATSSPTYDTSIWAEKCEIRPPPPRTSSKALTVENLITPSLKNLTNKMPLAILYKPHEQKRELRPMERGYWLINWQTWDTKLQDRCWECLGNFVGKGYGGWGVWCIRNVQHESFRVYCWGVVVEHIYLLLYMASESKIKRSAAHWIGGDGEAVIKMPS